jgi:hypothetical protein
MAIPLEAAARSSAGVLATLLVLVAAARPASPPPDGPSARLVLQEPAAAAAFVAAYARGDEAGAERLASPLYRAEWARLGVLAAERAAVGPPAGALAFRYGGGVRVDGGFAQLLYIVRATAPDGRPVLSVWRADTDPAGRVVWLQLVRLLSDRVGAAEPVRTTADAPALPLPTGRAARRPVVLVGVRAVGGREGYYALGLPTAAGPPVPAGFVALDADGEPHPGVWSYGRPPSLEYGVQRPAVRIDLAADLAALRGAYLGTLRWVD